ncbi:amino acid ABC transporter substrate-binding protein [Nicoliella spurrieriana]|uniref:Amino acid ABC transporter substrate-binding protein n=1 Tax=Nicoliella spurrieriana TaxID=2925830 RepID=A0A976X5L4_9LACO|nr:amino acid ABC transporter substrate-binding protein [Nicoliella spurrieriana]UQS86804.1 amino acid ABC transporter substrate-binding protein [Nicoliella spurrieriana]
MKKIYKWLSLLLIAVVGLSLSGCESVTQRANTENTWNKIQRKKEVVVGLDDSFVPFGFETKAGKITGYDIDLARAVFKQYGIKVSFQPIDWSMNVTELRNGTIDLIWNGLTVTPERAKMIAFSKPYLYNDQELVSLKKSNIRNFNDMQGKELGTQTGSSEIISLDKQPKLLKDKIKNHQPVLYDSFTDAFIDLNAQRVSGLLIDSTYANYYIKHESTPNKYSTYVGAFPKSKLAVGVRKGDTTLRNKINDALVKMAKNGQLKKITKKWFGNQYDSPLLKKYDK